MNLSKIQGGPRKMPERLRPISETDLSRLVDMYLIKPEATEEEAKAIKEGKPYQWMKKAFTDGYRMAEKGVRPKPIIELA
jgi:hypothetical protein